MNERIGFIGGGRVTRIFLEGWARADRMPAHVVVADPDAAARGKLAARFPSVRTTTDIGEAAAQDIVFLATHPPALAAAAGAAATALKAEAILVSLAPKWTIAKLAGLLAGFSGSRGRIRTRRRWSGRASTRLPMARG